MKVKGNLFVLSAPSGSGKGTVIKELMKINKNIESSISVTSRKPRFHEQEGIHYFFVEKEEFESMIRNGDFLEWDCYNDRYYGTKTDYIQKLIEAGKDVVFDITIKGAFAIKEKYPEAVLIFMLASSNEELRRRLTERGTEDEEVILWRLSEAEREIRCIDKFDYLLMNDIAADAAQRFNTIISAEQYRTRREYIDFIKKNYYKTNTKFQED